MPPRFGTPLPGPSLADMAEGEREKKNAREAERAKASSPGGPGTGLLVRPAHPMMIRPTAQMVSSYMAGGTIDTDLMKGWFIDDYAPRNINEGTYTFD